MLRGYRIDLIDQQMCKQDTTFVQRMIDRYEVLCDGWRDKLVNESSDEDEIDLSFYLSVRPLTAA